MSDLVAFLWNPLLAVVGLLVWGGIAGVIFAYGLYRYDIWRSRTVRR